TLLGELRRGRGNAKQKLRQLAHAVCSAGHCSPLFTGSRFSSSCATLVQSNKYFCVLASTPAHSIFGLSLFVLAVTAAIFVIVFSLLTYCVVKFRKRAGDDGPQPP